MERLFIFDFDGVVSFLFDDYDLSSAEREMQRSMLSHGLDISGHGNIFTVPELVRSSDLDAAERTAASLDACRILSLIEKDAAGKAGAVPGFTQVLPVLMEKGISVAMASNNDPDAVMIFLDRFFPGLSIPVFGRDPLHAERMKPSSWMLERAMEHFSASRENTVFFGDALSDKTAAERAGVGFYGFRSSEKNRHRFDGVLGEERLLSDWYGLIELI